MMGFVATMLDAMPGWGRATVLAVLLFLIVVGVRRIMGKRLGSLSGSQYFFGFLLAFFVGIFAESTRILDPTLWFYEYKDVWISGMRFAVPAVSLMPYPMSVDEFVGAATLFVPIGMLLPAAFPKGLGSLRRALAAALGLNVVCLAIQFVLYPAGFGWFQLLANLVWTGVGYLFYGAVRKQIERFFARRAGLAE